MPDSEDVGIGGETRRSLLNHGRSRLGDAGREAPRRAAEWILSDVLGCDRVQLHTEPDSTVSRAHAERFRDMIARYCGGEPLQHVLGHTSFRGLKIQVSPAVMVPRPETEQVVEHALRAIRSQHKPRVLDIGTGSGCIALAIKSERSDARVHGWDVSADALDVARSNAEQLGLDVDFSQVDVFGEERDSNLEESVTLLVSNPPYIPRNEAQTLPDMVRRYDPDVALFSGDDPLSFYRRIAEHVSSLCAPGAAVVFETHADYAEAAAEEVRAQGLTDVHIQDDLSGRPRILKARHMGEEGIP